MKTSRILYISILFLFSNCQKLPSKVLSQFDMKIDSEVSNDSLKLGIRNPVSCPIRVVLKSSNEAVQQKIEKIVPIILTPNSQTSVALWTDKTMEQLQMKYSVTIGNPDDKIEKQKMSLPFQKNCKYKVIQGYNGKYSHTSEYSKNALDFNLMEGDTICAAADGVVVGVIEGYSEGGKSKKWRDYANYITIFHPQMNLYTQYVHLVHQGSLVEVGDQVKSEQPIGLSGKTGHTDMEHLHFNVLKANKSGMESVTIEFKEGYKGMDMKRGDLVEK